MLKTSNYERQGILVWAPCCANELYSFQTGAAAQAAGSGLWKSSSPLPQPRAAGLQEPKSGSTLCVCCSLSLHRCNFSSALAIRLPLLSWSTVEKLLSFIPATPRSATVLRPLSSLTILGWFVSSWGALRCAGGLSSEHSPQCLCSVSNP